MFRSAETIENGQKFVFWERSIRETIKIAVLKRVPCKLRASLSYRAGSVSETDKTGASR